MREWPTLDGTRLERPVTCERCGLPHNGCDCPHDATGPVLPPSLQPARVRRRRGKVVTVVAGLDPNATDLAALLKEWRATLGAGGTISEGEIEVQGDHRERILADLVAKGYPAKASGG